MLYRLTNLADRVMQWDWFFNVYTPVVECRQTEKRAATRESALCYMNSTHWFQFPVVD